MKRPHGSTAAQAAAGCHGAADARPAARFVDGFLESYVAWREHCADVRAAYARWSDAGRADRAAAFASYGAALDREACAARTHEVRVIALARAAHILGGAR